jgi:hypothetical protein
MRSFSKQWKEDEIDFHGEKKCLFTHGNRSTAAFVIHGDSIDQKLALGKKFVSAYGKTREKKTERWVIASVVLQT